MTAFIIEIINTTIFVTAQRKKCEISKKVLDTVLLQECQNAFPARTCHAWASGVVDSLVQGFSG